MYRYQSSGRSLTLTPESHRWADKVAYLNAQQLYSKNATESTPDPRLYNKSFFNSYIISHIISFIQKYVY
ncbi:unnamed protein product [Adineta ricciae]|uniref:Uncharacterized protein n=1 Tax=Adineta ricciae TaxID=249248 RepID=A0A815R2X9_ADIRI|nr:unnamed protein product [Adineta ricciae]